MGEYAEELKKLYSTQIEAISNRRLDRDIHKLYYRQTALLDMAIAISNLTDEVKALREEIACAKQQKAEEDIAEHQQTIEKLKSELKRCCYGPRD